MSHASPQTPRSLAAAAETPRNGFATLSGIPLKPCYGPGDAPEAVSAERPGEFPFTRGIHPDMYRGRLWTMRQYAGFGTAKESNARYRYLLGQGQMGISVAFDLPTQIGYDPDHPLALGEVGKVGVSICSIEDMEMLLEGIPLDRISTSMTINATAAVLLCLYVAVAESRGIPAEALRGTVQNDILKEYIARGTYIFPAEPSLRLITDTIAFCRERVPKWNAISISGYHIREAGATAVQEVAFTLADAVAYVEACRAAGLDVDHIGRQLSFFFNVHNHFLEEVAKFRAARRLWARIMRERFGARTDDACKLRFHAQTAGSALTAQQPWNNVVRVSLQALAAVLGGAQSLHTNSMDEALALPTEEAVRLALRTQQLIAEETGVTGTADPFGGAYAVEALTEEIERRAEEIIVQIDRMGGMLLAIERGWVQRQIQESAYAAQRSVDSGEITVVGVNRYASEGEAPIPTLQLRPEVEAEQRERLARLRAGRDAAAVSARLVELGKAARGRENLLPFILEAVKARATVGEVSDALRSVFGLYREQVVV
ncbi:MAG: methylmalonyl-CoA mutase [Candidatus Tectomicrobia bacterium]|uniref:Methylmalonyl-CoA mutase n=1 Tax=Tectimicrobiota bacterium TaxID=2528274 RepID=A0A932MKI5_UNCTE|nr:methylmalonyl-CoA mutase [Candidatus Tectomicrobia bacterium]